MRCVRCSIGISEALDSGVEQGGAARDDAVQALGEEAIPIERGRGRLRPDVVHDGVDELLAHEDNDGAYEGGIESTLSGTRRA